MELDYHTPEEYKSMNLEISYKAREIIDAHIKGQPIVNSYMGGVGFSKKYNVKVF